MFKITYMYRHTKTDH